MVGNYSEDETTKAIEVFYRQFAPWGQLDSITEEIEEKVNLLKRLRWSGDPSSSLTHTTQMTDQLDKMVKRYSGQDRRRLQRLLALAVTELLETKIEVGARSDIVSWALDDAMRLRGLAEELEDDTLLGSAYGLLGDVYYVAGEHAHSVATLRTALRHISDPGFRGRCLRVLALDYAYLGQQVNFETTRRDVLTLIDKGEFAALMGIGGWLAGVGRGLALLNMRGSWRTLEEARHSYDQGYLRGEKGVIELVKILRSQLVAATLLPGKADPELAAHIGQQAVNLTHAHGYTRFLRDIRSLLRKLGLEVDTSIIVPPRNEEIP